MKAKTIAELFIILITLCALCVYVGYRNGKNAAISNAKETLYKMQRDTAMARFKLSQIREGILIDQVKRKDLKIQALEKYSSSLSVQKKQTIIYYEKKIASLATAPDSIVDNIFRAKYRLELNKKADSSRLGKTR